MGMNPDELERVFTLCDGRASARRVIDLSRLGTFEGARALVALLREGLLHVEHLTPKAPRMAAPERRSMFGESRQSISITLLFVPNGLNTPGRPRCH